MKAILSDFRATKEYDVMGRGEERSIFPTSMTFRLEVKVFLEGEDSHEVERELLDQAAKLGR